MTMRLEKTPICPGRSLEAVRRFTTVEIALLRSVGRAEHLSTCPSFRERTLFSRGCQHGTLLFLLETATLF
jgi:hypothetical protein